MILNGEPLQGKQAGQLKGCHSLFEVLAQRQTNQF
jgi:hypothetical protein